MIGIMPRKLQIIPLFVLNTEIGRYIEDASYFNNNHTHIAVRESTSIWRIAYYHTVP